MGFTWSPLPYTHFDQNQELGHFGKLTPPQRGRIPEMPIAACFGAENPLFFQGKNLLPDVGIFRKISKIRKHPDQYIQAIIYDFFPYQKCKKSEVAVPEGAGGTEGLFLEEMNLRLKYHRCTAQGGFPATG